MCILQEERNEAELMIFWLLSFKWHDSFQVPDGVNDLEATELSLNQNQARILSFLHWFTVWTRKSFYIFIIFFCLFFCRAGVFLLLLMLPIYDHCCGSGMFILDPNFFHPVSQIRVKELKYFSPKKWFESSRKYDPGWSSRIRILIFYPSRIMDPGGKKAPDPGYESVTLFMIFEGCRTKRACCDKQARYQFSHLSFFILS